MGDKKYIIGCDLSEFPEIEFEQEEQTLALGIVSNCKKLNIRKSPHKESEVETIVNVGDELIVTPEESVEEWYRVHTAAGLSGFCMKDFVSIQE